MASGWSGGISRMALSSSVSRSSRSDSASGRSVSTARALFPISMNFCEDMKVFIMIIF